MPALVNFCALRHKGLIGEGGLFQMRNDGEFTPAPDAARGKDNVLAAVEAEAAAEAEAGNPREAVDGATGGGDLSGFLRKAIGVHRSAVRAMPPVRDDAQDGDSNNIRSNWPVKGLRLMKAAGQLAVDWALPPRCPTCGVVVAGDQQLCPPCWMKLEFLDGAACIRCSMPLVQHRNHTPAECGACLADPPDFFGAPAAVVYGDGARTLALRLKHGRRIGDARLMARLMARKMHGLIDDAAGMEALLLPVPLHRWRLWARGFNQSAVLANNISAISGIAQNNRALVRIKSTPVLRGKGRKERRDILRGAFAIAPEYHGLIRGKHAILVDDVHASGATFRAAAKLLKQAGAGRISAISWARVVPPAIMTSNLFDIGAWDSDISPSDKIG